MLRLKYDASSRTASVNRVVYGLQSGKGIIHTERLKAQTMIQELVIELKTTAISSMAFRHELSKAVPLTDKKTFFFTCLMTYKVS